jgi:hypothetical protein
LHDAYRALAATWPFQVRRHEFGSLIGRYSVAHERIIKTGFIGQQVIGAVSSELKPKIESINWANLSRSQRKTEWLRLCLSAVRRLERLLVELKTERRTEQEASYSLDTIASQQSPSSLPASSKATSHVDDSRMERQNRRNRARRLAASASKMGTAVPRKGRKATADLPSVNPHSSEQGRPAFRIRRLRISEAVEQKHLVARDSEQPALRIRRLGINEAVDKKRREARLAAITERTQQHTKRQQLRSKRRMQLMCMRMEWNRQQQEKTEAGDDLWQQAQKPQHGSSQQGNAWPMAKWQREQLADEVQAFVRGKR